MTDIDWQPITELAKRVGKKYAAKYPGIDAEDISQEVLVKLVEHPDILRAFPENIAVVTALMGKLAAGYASMERYDYTVRSAKYLYTPDEVRALLEHAYWDESLRETSVPTGPDDRTALVVWQNVCVALWDLDAAFTALNPADAFRLQSRYWMGNEFPTDAAKKACYRAVDTLTRYLNERVNRSTVDHDGPGSRKAGKLPAAA